MDRDEMETAKSVHTKSGPRQTSAAFRKAARWLKDRLRIGAQQLELRETNEVEVSTLSDAAAVLVKLHEFFEEIRKRGAK